MIKVVDCTILTKEVLDELKCDASGSVVMHMGIVRPYSEGKQVNSIEYTANKGNAEKELVDIAHEIKSKWEIQDIGLCRRIGNLGLGETILVVAVSAPHRKDAFEACQYAVEKLRGMNSMKKKEIYE